MSRGHNKGSGHHRQPNAWVAIAKGRSNKPRVENPSVRCPHGHHAVPAKAFLSHLNGCKAGLARTVGAA